MGTSNPTSTKGNKDTSIKSLRIATHNVMVHMNWLLEFIVRTPERHSKEMEILKELDADVIGLNEVTSEFLTLLQQQEWVRQNYFLSDGIVEPNKAFNDSVLTPEKGNILMSKHPFDRLDVFSFSHESDCVRNVIIGSFFGGQLVIASAHITAYEELYERRAKQLHEVCNLLNSPDTIIMGDLNLHRVVENQLIVDVGYDDLWKPTEDDPDGFTWDTEKNKMLNQFLILDRRRMRLDRIIAKKGCQWEADNVKLFATEPVHEGGYLFPSDHFGLITQIQRRQ